MIFSKKGSLMNSSTLLMAVVVVLIYFVISSPSISSDGIQLSSSGDSCTPVVEITSGGVTSGVTEIKTPGTNHFELIVEDADLNSANITENIGLNLTTSLVEACRGPNGAQMDHIITYEFSSQTFENLDDPTDTTDYHAIEWNSIDNKWDVTVDGVAYAGVFKATDTLASGTDGSASLHMDIEDHTTLDKGLENDFEKMEIARLNILVDGKKSGDVITYFMQD